MVKLTQNSWLGGQLDSRMAGRQDMANYRNGASVLKNFLPVKIGSIRKRPGTDHVCDLTEWLDGRKFRMIPYGYLSGSGYVLVVASDAHARCEARAYRADGTFAEVTGMIPYTADELDEIGYVQCGDILFIAHKNHPPAEIRHNDEDEFDYSAVTFNPVVTKPTVGTPEMTRQYFDDFTFKPYDQAKLDQCKTKGDFWTDSTWAQRYEGIYNDETRRQYSGKTVVRYRASVILDGSEGPLSDEPSVPHPLPNESVVSGDGFVAFTSPWTESQVVKIPVTVEIPERTRAWELRLYKENGGMWGIVGVLKSNGNDTISFRFVDVVTGHSTRPNPSYVVNVYKDGDRSATVVPQVSSTWSSRKLTVTCDVSVDFDPDATTTRLDLVRTLDGDESVVGTEEFGQRHTVEHVFIDDNIAPDTSETPIDTTGDIPFAKDGDHPGSVGLYQQRLIWAGSRNDPARIWMSRAGDFWEYRPHMKLQLDDAIDFILPITQLANINFIVELGRLFAFSECAELVIGSASDIQGVSYETIMATEHSHLGCTKRLPPIVANNTLLFVNRTGDSVRDYDEQLGSTRFGGKDVSVFSASVFTDNPIVDWTWQQEPNSTVWCVLSDGRLASFTYDKEQKIMAWAAHELGGDGKAVGIAKTCAVFGREAGRPTTGEVMVAVERGGRITLERMRPWGGRGGKYVDRLCMDAMEPGRVHGKTVVELPDGTAVSGYKFESVMTTIHPVIGDQVGQAQFDIKLGQHAHLRTIDSEGGEVFAVGMGQSPSAIKGTREDAAGYGVEDCDVVLAGSNGRDGRVTVRHDEPGPFQLALLELDYEVES